MVEPMEWYELFIILSLICGMGNYVTMYLPKLATGWTAEPFQSLYGGLCIIRPPIQPEQIILTQDGLKMEWYL